MQTNSITIRRRAPEGTVYTTLRYVPETKQPDLVLISVGKAGSRLNAAADWGARLAGAAFRAGASVDRVAEITSDIRHDHSNGHFEASSLADAVAQSFREFQRLVEETRAVDVDPRGRS